VRFDSLVIILFVPVSFPLTPVSTACSKCFVVCAADVTRVRIQLFEPYVGHVFHLLTKINPVHATSWTDSGSARVVTLLPVTNCLNSDQQISVAETMWTGTRFESRQGYPPPSVFVQSVETNSGLAFATSSVQSIACYIGKELEVTGRNVNKTLASFPEGLRKTTKILGIAVIPADIEPSTCLIQVPSVTATPASSVFLLLYPV
jgi:hypothetical protein